MLNKVQLIGLCGKDPESRFFPSGDQQTTDQKRITGNSVVDKNTGCWNWSLSKQRNGYGQIKHKTKMKRAHRVSFEAFNHEIPIGIEVMHLCDNRACVNPGHLVSGTHQENMKDQYDKGRVPSGEKHHMFGKPGIPAAKRTQSRPVEIDGVIYDGIREAENKLNVSHGAVRFWLKSGRAKYANGAVNAK